MEKEIVVNGSKIAYFDEGEGFPLLVLHGWGPWLGPPYVKFRGMLASHGFRVIFLSLPGFGESSVPSSKWGMDEYLTSILSFIEQLNLEKFFLFGHSMGGAMSIKLAASHPEKIKALILLAPGVFFPFRFMGISIGARRLMTIGFNGYLVVIRTLEIFLSFLLAVIRNLSFLGIKLVRFKKIRDWLEDKISRILKKAEHWLDMLGPQFQFFFSKGRLMSKILNNIVGLENIVDYLPKIKTPTLIIWGEKDFWIFTICARFLGRIPNYDFKIIPEAGHNAQEDAPEKVVEMIMNFIKKLDETEKVTLKE